MGITGANFTDADWQRVEHDWTAWWAHELPRPLLVAVSAPGGVGWMWQPVAHRALTASAADLAEEKWRDLGRATWHGDAWPRYCVNFGAGAAAAFLGGRLEATPETDTVWFHPGIWEGKELRDIQPAYDADNAWWRRTREVTAACAARFGRGAQVGVADIGGTLDIAASLRGAQELLMDCVDDPDGVGELCRRLTALWPRYYRELRALTVSGGRGGGAWAPLWSPARLAMLQCDFSYMFSPAMFARWVAPDLAACCAELDHGFYHLDGVGQLPHLDHLLAVPRLRGVQWVPGDGQPDATAPEWWPLYQRLRAAGKLVQIFTRDHAALLRMAREVPLTGFTIALLGSVAHADELIAAVLRENATLTKPATVSGAGLATA
jgi:5-methyltetrahydrofolate--homocysteine methyltransferase